MVNKDEYNTDHASQTMQGYEGKLAHYTSTKVLTLMAQTVSNVVISLPSQNISLSYNPQLQNLAAKGNRRLSDSQKLVSLTPSPS